MKIAVTGSHGLIGSALIPQLSSAGHTVTRIVRGPARAGEVSWDPAAASLDAAALAGTDAVVHLAGVGIADKRWNDSHRRAVTQSRVDGTRLIAQTLAKVDPRPSVLLSGSAIGFYGDRGAAELDEASASGTGFLADVCRQWEQATAPAEDAGIRVVHLRSGVVLTPAGGALAKQLPLFRLGIGGRLGSGRQYVSWISLDDEVGAIQLALSTEALRGPVNLTAPQPVTNAELASAIGHALGRPAVVPVPSFALRIALGPQMATEMLLGGARVMPRALQRAGYRFEHPEVTGALTALLPRRQHPLRLGHRRPPVPPHRAGRG